MAAASSTAFLILFAARVCGTIALIASVAGNANDDLCAKYGVVMTESRDLRPLQTLSFFADLPKLHLLLIVGFEGTVAVVVSFSA